MLYPIILDGYTVFGMCQYAGSMDYIVALHENTNEVHIIRTEYDIIRDVTNIKDYKKVDKDDFLTKLEGNVLIDC